MWLQPHYNLVEREGYEREYAPIVERYGLAVAPYYALASGFLTGKYRGDGDGGDSPRAETAAGYLDERGRAVLAALDEVAAAHEVEVAAVAIAWLLAKPGVVAPIASARTVEQLDAVCSCGGPRADRGRDRPPGRGLGVMDATRQAFLDELYAHGRAHDEQREDRLQRLRNVEPETAELLGVLVRALERHPRARGRHVQRLLDDLARRRRRGRRRHRPQPRDRGRAHRAGPRRTSTEAGVADFVELRTQDAAEALASFADDAFDLIFLDAERPLYASYWPDLIRALRPNGLLVVDNMLSHAKELVEFSELVYAAPQVTSTLVTVGAGVLLIVKSLCNGATDRAGAATAWSAPGPGPCGSPDAC